MKGRGIEIWLLFILNIKYCYLCFYKFMIRNEIRKKLRSLQGKQFPCQLFFLQKNVIHSNFFYSKYSIFSLLSFNAKVIIQEYNICIETTSKYIIMQHMQEIICKKKLKIYLNETCRIKSANAIISKITIICNQKKKKRKICQILLTEKSN